MVVIACDLKEDAEMQVYISRVNRARICNIVVNFG